MTRASQPPITRNTMAINTYMMPIFLWSTVTTHSCSTAVQFGCSREVAWWTIDFGSTTAIVELAQGEQIIDDRIAVTIRKSKRRHQAPLLDLLRIGYPAAKILCI